MSSIDINLRMPFLALLQTCKCFKSLERDDNHWFCTFITKEGIIEATNSYENPVRAVQEMMKHDKD